MDWKLLVTQMVMVKSQIFEADKEKLWPYNFPNVAASERQIQRMKKKIGKDLPVDYVDFLKTANGWKGFFQNNDLIGTEDFDESKYVMLANEEFFSLDEAVVEGIKKEELFLVGINLTDRDLFFLVLSDNEKKGEVVWFAGEEVERFKNFSDFFASMIAYNKRELHKLKGEPV